MTNENKLIIEPEKFYSASKLIREGVFPWIKSAMTFHAILRTKEGAEKFKPIIRQGYAYRKYFIKGETVLGILKEVENNNLSY